MNSYTVGFFAVEMALGALGVPHGRGGVQAAVEYLGREVPPGA